MENRREKDKNMKKRGKGEEMRKEKGRYKGKEGEYIYG
jgi:hypothetical protein